MSEAVGALRRRIARLFAEAGVDTPDLDARLLVGYALRLDHLALVREADSIIGEKDVQHALALAARRIGGVPVARLIGSKEFWGLPLRIGDATLVPRPDTETVVEAALAACPNGARRIADLGTGSGALLLALLSELPDSFGVGTDLSENALCTVWASATDLGLNPRARFVRCDFGAALAGGFDLVVSNPPYVESGALATLPRDVQSDPHLALDGGADGLDAYRAIAADARRLLAPGGIVVLELGAGQEASVAALMREHGMIVRGPARSDLGGVPRALIGHAP